MVPSSAKTGRSRARRSGVTSARAPSSNVNVEPGTWVISSSNRPSSVAAIARACEREANSSCSSLAIPSGRWYRSVAAPTWIWSNPQTRASESSASVRCSPTTRRGPWSVGTTNGA